MINRYMSYAADISLYAGVPHAGPVVSLGRTLRNRVAAWLRRIGCPHDLTRLALTPDRRLCLRCWRCGGTSRGSEPLGRIRQ